MSKRRHEQQAYPEAQAQILDSGTPATTRRAQNPGNRRSGRLAAGLVDRGVVAHPVRSQPQQLRRMQADMLEMGF